MVDTPKPDDQTEYPADDLKGPGAFPHPANTTKSHQHREKTSYYAHTAKYIIQALNAIGRGALKTVHWIDSKGPLISAVATVIIASLTYSYVHYSRAQWETMRAANCINKQAADAATTAANTAEKQLEMSERPWIVSQYTPSAPLQFTADGGATFEVTGKITNIGHSVALTVHDTPLIDFESPGVSMFHPTDKQKDVCNRIREMGEKFPILNEGDILFPQDVTYEIMPLVFTKEDIQKARVGKTDIIEGLVIIGCVDYTFSFSSKHHQTGYVYEIVRPHPGGGATPIKIGETVQPNQLIIRRSLFGGFYAD